MFRTIIPAWSISIGGRELATLHEVEVKTSRRYESDRCSIRVPWTAELDELREGDRVIVSLGNSEIGLGVVFYGVLEEQGRDGVAGNITARDRLENMVGVAFTGGWKEGDSLSSACDEVLAAAGLVGVGYDPDGATLPQDVAAKDADAWEVMRRLLEFRGWDCWIVPGGESVYYGPRWPYQIGAPGFDQTEAYAFDLRSGEVFDAQIERKSAPLYKSCIMYIYDGEFSGGETVVGGAVWQATGSVEGAGGEEPVLVIRKAGKVSKEEALSEANAAAVEALDNANFDRITGTIQAPLNPFVLHSQRVRVDDQGVNEFLPVTEITYRLSATEGSEMEMQIAGE